MTQLDKPVAQVGAAPAMTLRVGRRVAGAEVANACYFRSGAIPGGRKALLQVTERCDLRCAHCFVSATRRGDLLELVTLLTGTGVAVTICTNGVSVTTDQIAALRRLPGTSVNVSLDGFSRNSHGRFRGDRDSFDVTVANIRRLGDAGLLKGILCTPNALADPSEFAAIYLFGEEAGAEYVLLNPLSSFGRSGTGVHPFPQRLETSVGMHRRGGRVRLRERRHRRLPVSCVCSRECQLQAQPQRVHRGKPLP